MTKSKAMKDNLLSFEDLENLRLAEDLLQTCVETYFVTSTGLAPEIAYFHVEVGAFVILCQKYCTFIFVTAVVSVYPSFIISVNFFVIPTWLLFDSNLIVVFSIQAGLL